MARSFMLGNTSPQKTTMRFIFGEDKKLLAFVSEAPPRKLLHVLENPNDTMPTRRFFISGKSYWLENGRPELFSSQRLVRYRINPTRALYLWRNAGISVTAKMNAIRPAVIATSGCPYCATTMATKTQTNTPL